MSVLLDTEAHLPKDGLRFYLPPAKRIRIDDQMKLLEFRACGVPVPQIGAIVSKPNIHRSLPTSPKARVGEASSPLFGRQSVGAAGIKPVAGATPSLPASVQVLSRKLSRESAAANRVAKDGHGGGGEDEDANNDVVLAEEEESALPWSQSSPSHFRPRSPEDPQSVPSSPPLPSSDGDLSSSSAPPSPASSVQQQSSLPPDSSVATSRCPASRVEAMRPTLSTPTASGPGCVQSQYTEPLPPERPSDSLPTGSSLARSSAVGRYSPVVAVPATNPGSTVSSQRHKPSSAAAILQSTPQRRVAGQSFPDTQRSSNSTATRSITAVVVKIDQICAERCQTPSMAETVVLPTAVVKPLPIQPIPKAAITREITTSPDDTHLSKPVPAARDAAGSSDEISPGARSRQRPLALPFDAASPAHQHAGSSRARQDSGRSDAREETAKGKASASIPWYRDDNTPLKGFFRKYADLKMHRGVLGRPTTGRQVLESDPVQPAVFEWTL